MPTLLSLNSFRDATVSTFNLQTTSDHLAQVVADNNIATDSELLGGENAQTLLRDVVNVDKTEITYTLATGDDGSKFYYSQAKSYRLETNQSFIRIVKHPKQIVKLTNTSTGWFGYTRVSIYTVASDGTFHHHTTNLHAGQTLDA